MTLIYYFRISGAISKVKHKIINIPDEIHKIKFHDFECSKLDRKKIYRSILVQERCYCEKFLEKKNKKPLNESTWENIFKYVKETKLQEIQWKILHNIFPSNILLNRMGIKGSEKCDHCDEKDFIEHYFYNCPFIKNIWTEINQIICNTINKVIKLNEQVILYGIEQDSSYTELQSNDIKFINNILLTGKLSIIKSKAENLNVSLVFEREFTLRKSLSEYNLK